jgi:hypothetical protein
LCSFVSLFRSLPIDSLFLLIGASLCSCSSPSKLLVSLLSSSLPNVTSTLLFLLTYLHVNAAAAAAAAAVESRARARPWPCIWPAGALQNEFRALSMRSNFLLSRSAENATIEIQKVKARTRAKPTSLGPPPAARSPIHPRHHPDPTAPPLCVLDVSGRSRTFYALGSSDYGLPLIASPLTGRPHPFHDKPHLTCSWYVSSCLVVSDACMRVNLACALCRALRNCEARVHGACGVEL